IITDALGCMFIDSNLVLTDLRSLTLTNNVQNVLCNGNTTGSIGVTVIESVVTGNNFTFNWTPSGFMAGGASPSATYSGLPAGTYSVLAFDNLGCQIADTFIITQPSVLRIDSLGQTNPGCAQVNSGSISVQAFGGAGGINAYTYAWNPPAAPNNQNQTGLPFGTYTVTVTDANMCTVTRQFNLPMPTPPNFIAGPSSLVKCGGDGSLTATAPTAAVIVWADINGIVIDSFFSSPATISSLDGGDYVVRIFDGGGCFATDTITLAGVIPMSFSDTTFMEPDCFGLNNGQIAIGIQDGQPPYVNYSWDPMQNNSPVIFGLISGTYTVTVTDNVGCTLVGTFLLGQPAAIVNSFDPTVLGRVTCFGGTPCDGAATPLPAYTNGPGTFNFLWSDGSTDSLRVDLCAGVNIVTITDADNCFTIDTVVITTPPPVTLGSLMTTQTLCYGDSTGTATIVATGGNGGPYSYAWNTGDSTANVTGLPAGNYTVTLTDNMMCTNSINTIVIGQPAQIGLMTTFTDPFCFGGNNGQVQVEVLGGVPNYTYHWENAAGDDVGNNFVAEMLVAGTYNVTVTDMNGCSSVTSEIVTDPPPVVGSYAPLAALTCNGDETTLNILSITGGSGGPYSFSVDFGAVLDPNFPVTIGGGIHYITYIDKSCSITDSFFVAEPTPITVSFDPPVIEIELGATADLEPIITGAAVIDAFSWTNIQTLLNPDTLNATAYTFTNLSYTLTVQDSFGCSGSGTVVVNVDPNRNVYLPNIFKPANASGLNDHFNVYIGLGVEIVNFMRIYDRWGELLYAREKFIPDSDNLSEGWDGTYNGDFVNPGVFVYLVEVKFLDGRVLLYRGDVTVVR
ncbi:MAG: gliding motility-associated C-terminal domain-containing protein, partial [Saprospiraceae bacterium]